MVVAMTYGAELTIRVSDESGSDVYD
jgi:hypothetical protein